MGGLGSVGCTLAKDSGNFFFSDNEKNNLLSRVPTVSVTWHPNQRPKAAGLPSFELQSLPSRRCLFTDPFPGGCGKLTLRFITT